MDSTREYFPAWGEWSHQEREFAARAVQAIGLGAWQDLLRIQRLEGRQAFIQALHERWPAGLPLQQPN